MDTNADGAGRFGFTYLRTSRLPSAGLILNADGRALTLQAEATLCSAAAPARLSHQEITTVVEYFADLAAVVRDADPTDKAEIYRGLNLVLTYQPAAQTVRA